MNISVGFEGQEIQFFMDNIFGFLHHLGFGNPEGGFGYSHRKIIDFNSIKLADGYFDRINYIEHLLFSQEFVDCFIFQTAEGQECFCQKIS